MCFGARYVLCLYIFIGLFSNFFCLEDFQKWRHKIQWKNCGGRQSVIPAGKENSWKLSCGSLLVPLKYGVNGTFQSNEYPLPISFRRLTRWKDNRSVKIRSTGKDWRREMLLSYDKVMQLKAGKSNNLLEFQIAQSAETIYYEDVIKNPSLPPNSSIPSIFKGFGDPKLSKNEPDFKKDPNIDVIYVNDEKEDDLLPANEYYIASGPENSMDSDSLEYIITSDEIEMIINGEERLADALRRRLVNDLFSNTDDVMQLYNPPVECYETSLVLDASKYSQLLVDHGISSLREAVMIQRNGRLMHQYVPLQSFEENTPKAVSPQDLLKRKLSRLEDYSESISNRHLNLTQSYPRSYRPVGEEESPYPGLKWDPLHYVCKKKPENHLKVGGSYKSRILFRGGRFWHRKQVPCPRLHIWMLGGGTGEYFVNSRLVDLISQSIHEPFHFIIPNYRGTRQADVFPISYHNADKVDVNNILQNLLLPASYTSLEQSAYDVLYLMRRFKEELYPRLDSRHIIHSNSFDSLWAQRVVALNSQDIQGLILDSPVSPTFKLNVDGPLAERELLISLYDICKFDPYCKTKIKSSDELLKAILRYLDPSKYNECTEFVARSIPGVLASRNEEICTIGECQHRLNMTSSAIKLAEPTRLDNTYESSYVPTLASWAQENMFSYLLGLGVGFMGPHGDRLPVDFRVAAIALMYQGSHCHTPYLFKNLFLNMFPYKNTGNITFLLSEKIKYHQPLNINFMRSGRSPSHPTIHYSIMFKDFWEHEGPLNTFKGFRDHFNEETAIQWTRFEAYYRLQKIFSDPKLDLFEKEFPNRLRAFGNFIWSRRNLQHFLDTWNDMYTGKCNWSLEELYMPHCDASTQRQLEYSRHISNLSYWTRLKLIMSKQYQAIFSKTQLSDPLANVNLQSSTSPFVCANATRLILVTGCMNQIIPKSQAHLIARHSSFQNIDSFRFWRAGHSVLSHVKSCAPSIFAQFYNFTCLPWNPDTIWPVSHLVQSAASIRHKAAAIVRNLVLKREMKRIWEDYSKFRYQNSNETKMISEGRHVCIDFLSPYKCHLRGPIDSFYSKSHSGNSHSEIHLERRISSEILEDLSELGLSPDEKEELECAYFSKTGSNEIEDASEESSMVNTVSRLSARLRSFRPFHFDPSKGISGKLIVEGLYADEKEFPNLSKTSLQKMKDAVRMTIPVDRNVRFRLILVVEGHLENRIYRRYFYPAHNCSDKKFPQKNKAAILGAFEPNALYCDMGDQNKESGSLLDIPWTCADKINDDPHQLSPFDTTMKDAWIGKFNTDWSGTLREENAKAVLGGLHLNPSDAYTSLHIPYRDSSILQDNFDFHTLSNWPKHCRTLQEWRQIHGSGNSLNNLEFSQSPSTPHPTQQGNNDVRFYEHPGLNRLSLSTAPPLDDIFFAFKTDMSTGPLRCARTINLSNFLDWHQTSLLHFLGLSSYEVAGVGLLDDNPDRINWFAMIIAVILGSLIFVLISVLAYRRLSELSARYEARLRKRIRRRRRWMKIQRKLRMLQYLNYQHDLLQAAGAFPSLDTVQEEGHPKLPVIPGFEDINTVSLNSSLSSSFIPNISSSDTSFFSDISDSEEDDVSVVSSKEGSISLSDSRTTNIGKNSQNNIRRKKVGQAVKSSTISDITLKRIASLRKSQYSPNVSSSSLSESQFHSSDGNVKNSSQFNDLPSHVSSTLTTPPILQALDSSSFLQSQVNQQPNILSDIFDEEEELQEIFFGNSITETSLKHHQLPSNIPSVIYRNQHPHRSPRRNKAGSSSNSNSEFSGDSGYDYYIN